MSAATIPHLSLGWRRVLFGAAILALVAFLVSSATAHDSLLHILEGVKRVAVIHATLAAVLVVVFSAFAATIAFLSSWLIVPFAVHTWGPFGALFLIWGGWVLGGAASYALGRQFGPPVARWLGYAPLLARYEEWVSHGTPFALAFLFQLALPSEVRGYLFGLGRYPVGRYLLALALAELPFGVATVYLGEGIVQRRMALVVAMLVTLALLSVVALQALHRRLGMLRGVFEEKAIAAARPPGT